MPDGAVAPRASYVYGLCGEGAIKIGYASDPRQRRRTLQIGSAPRLVPMFCIPCQNETVAQHLERWIHCWLDTERLHGEWFSGPKTAWLACWLQRGTSRDEAAAIAASLHQTSL